MDNDIPTQADALGRFAQLRAKFPTSAVGKLPKPKSKDAPRGHCNECGGYHGLPAVHLDYVGHAAVTDRLLMVDPKWTWLPLACDERGLPAYDNAGGLWISLTILGVTRLGYGDGDTPKERIGDAIRNAAMRFGVALDLWSKEELPGTEGLAEIAPTIGSEDAPQGNGQAPRGQSAPAATNSASASGTKSTPAKSQEGASSRPATTEPTQAELRAAQIRAAEAKKLIDDGMAAKAAAKAPASKEDCERIRVAYNRAEAATSRDEALECITVVAGDGVTKPNQVPAGKVQALIDALDRLAGLEVGG